MRPDLSRRRPRLRGGREPARAGRPDPRGARRGRAHLRGLARRRRLAATTRGRPSSGSTPTTRRFQGVRFRRNYGKSAALAAGFARARGRYVATLDADLQDDPAELPAMVARLEAGADLVSGWKQTRHDPLEKTIPSRFFNGVTRLALGHPAARLQQRHQGVPLRGRQERPRLRRAPPLRPAPRQVGGLRADRGAGRCSTTRASTAARSSGSSATSAASSTSSRSSS